MDGMAANNLPVRKAPPDAMPDALCGLSLMIGCMGAIIAQR